MPSDNGLPLLEQESLNQKAKKDRISYKSFERCFSLVQKKKKKKFTDKTPCPE